MRQLLSAGNTWLDTLWRQRATQDRFLIIISIISGMLLCCKKFAVPLVGPLFVGPLFGRTCWTCLNPPMVVSVKVGHEIKTDNVNDNTKTTSGGRSQI